MSSAASTETDRRSTGGDAPEVDPGLQPWQLFTLAGLIGATIVVFVSRGHTPSGIILLSLIIFTAAIVGVAAWRTLMPFSIADESSGGQVIGGRTRAALEREKTLVLRSIKELEFDRAMGKVSEKDFAEMSARLRVRAAGLMRQLDAGSTYRDDIRKEIDRRIGSAAPLASAATSERRGSEPGSGGRGAPRLAAATVKCSHCGTDNDSDAQFCKRCGASLETSE